MGTLKFSPDIQSPSVPIAEFSVTVAAVAAIVVPQFLFYKLIHPSTRCHRTDGITVSDRVYAVQLNLFESDLIEQKTEPRGINLIRGSR